MECIIHIAIIYPKAIFRESLGWVLSEQPHIQVTRSVATEREMLDTTEVQPLDVILLDLSPDPNGRSSIRQLYDAFPAAKILAMGVTESERDVLACIEAGAAGYLPQDASLEELVRNIQAIVVGEAFCSPKVVGLLFSRLAERAREWEQLFEQDMMHLTRREIEIIQLLDKGMSNKEIAVRLYIEAQTVKNHVHNILKKLQLDDRREVVRYARERGLIRRRHCA